MTAAATSPAKTASRRKRQTRSSSGTRKKAASREGGRKRRAPVRRNHARVSGVRANVRVALVGGVAAALAAGFHVWTGLRTVELGYQRSRAIELRQRLDLQRQELADELEGFLHTENLEREAARRLGLGLPGTGQVVDLRRPLLADAGRAAREWPRGTGATGVRGEEPGEERP